MGWDRQALGVGVPVRLNRFRGSIKLKSVVFLIAYIQSSVPVNIKM